MADNDTQVAFNQALPETDTNTAFERSTALSNNDVPTPQAAATPQEPTGESVNVVNPEGKLVSIPHTQLAQAIQGGYSVAGAGEVKQAAHEAKYGSAGQQALAGLEGALEGGTFGLSAGIERLAGVDPEGIRGRAEVNPGTHALAQGLGLAASALIPGYGEANILKGAGEGAAATLGLGAKGAGYLSQVGADTVKAAFEAGIFQGGEEMHKMFANDPNQSAETAIADMGLASVLGGVFGGTVGAGLRKFTGANVEAPGGIPATEGLPLESGEVRSVKPSFVSEMDQPGVEAGDFKASIENSNILKPKEKEGILAGLSQKKTDAPQIEAAAGRLGAPVMEGMTSASHVVQKAEDSLINGAPTYSGLKRQELYTKGYNMAKGAVDDALGEGSTYSKAELGNIMKSSITDQLKEENQPIAQLYNEIKQYHKIIPLAEDSIPKISAELEAIPELRIAPSSPGAKLANDVFNEVGNLKTVDDIKAYRSSLYDRLPPTASSGEKRIAAVISDKLKQLEDASIENFAKSIPANDELKGVVENLIGQRKAADAQYKPFIRKIQTLSEQLGKGRIHGAQDAIHFITDLTPEQITQKLFAKNNSEFVKFFSKEFPDQMELMRHYQKGIVREGASKTGELQPKLVFNQVNKLEPEIQKSLFSAQELSKLKDAETYLRAFPKNFNPSGTSGMSAFRAFFEHPTGAAIGNVRDFAIEKFIKAVGSSPEVKNATELARSTVSGFNTMNKAIKAALDPTKATMPVAITASVTSREKIKKLVEDYSQNPQKMYEMNANNPVPEYNTAFSATSARAVQFLSGIKPNTSPQSPLDSKRIPNSMENARYNRALDIAQQPLMVMKHISQGTLTPQDLVTLKAIYPNLYNHLQSQLQQQIMDVASKGKTIPYQQRMGLSMFLGQALDSTMTQASIMAAQPLPKAPQQQNPQGMGGTPKRGTASLGKLPKQYQTPGQAAEADQSKR